MGEIHRSHALHGSSAAMTKSGNAEQAIINAKGVTKHYTRHTHERKWLLIDANGQSVGRLATQVADLLRGSTSPRSPGTTMWVISWS